MKTYSVCETSNMACVHYAERIWDAVADFDVENGMIGYLDGLAENESHTYNFIKGVKDGATLTLAHNPEWTEDTSRMTNQRKDKLFIPAGVKFRAYTLKKGDEFALSAEGFNSEPAVDKYVTVGTNGKLDISDTAPEGAVMVGKIMRKRQIGSTLVTGVRTYGYARMMYTVKVETLA